jgi:enamine deaminase RidA (YjgF/YER057c/UK114 family)
MTREARRFRSGRSVKRGQSEKIIRAGYLARQASIFSRGDNSGWKDHVACWSHRAATDDGKSLAGDFDAQVRQTFRNLEATLREAGGSLKDLVTMTVSLTDARHTTRMTEIRREIFEKDFAASAAITVAGLADPNMLIEIQAIAVLPE